MLSKYNRQLTELEDSLRVGCMSNGPRLYLTVFSRQSKQLQIDDLLHKLDEKEHELSRVVEEKEQELAIMQEGMDTTLQQMNELQQASTRTPHLARRKSNTFINHSEKERQILPSQLKSIL